MGVAKTTARNQSEFSKIERIACFTIGLKKMCSLFANQTKGFFWIEAYHKI